jgi:hypothetical protein
MGIEEDLVIVDKIEVDTSKTEQPTGDSEVQNDIERLSPAGKDAAAKAALFGGWTEGDADQDAIGRAADES